MKILVIGGSYFLGRVFVMLACGQHEVTVVNRGNQPLNGMNVREIRGERHDASLWRGIAEDADVLVDFCAYQPGDIRTVLENLACGVKQYILISTVDVYAHGQQGTAALADNLPGQQGFWTEDAPFETVRYPGEAGDYIAGKIALERELAEVCGPRGIQTTVLRPAVLYGPLNYAPRESVLIRMMARDGILPVITDADGRFRLLYVKDGAEAVLKCLLNEKTYEQAYNLCGDEVVSYRLLADALKKAAEGVKGAGARDDAGTEAASSLREVEFSVEQADRQGVLLPFPVTAEESMLCSNEKSKRELGLAYTSLEEGMGKTCRAFWDIV